MGRVRVGVGAFASAREGIEQDRDERCERQGGKEVSRLQVAQVEELEGYGEKDDPADGVDLG